MDKKKAKKADNRGSRAPRGRGSHPYPHVEQLAGQMQDLQVGDQQSQVQNVSYRQTQEGNGDDYFRYTSREWIPQSQQVHTQGGLSGPPPSFQQQAQHEYPPGGWAGQEVQQQQIGFLPPGPPPLQLENQPANSQYAVPLAAPQQQQYPQLEAGSWEHRGDQMQQQQQGHLVPANQHVQLTQPHTVVEYQQNIVQPEQQHMVAGNSQQQDIQPQAVRYIAVDSYGRTLHPQPARYIALDSYGNEISQASQQQMPGGQQWPFVDQGQEFHQAAPFFGQNMSSFTSPTHQQQAGPSFNSPPDPSLPNLFATPTSYQYPYSNPQQERYPTYQPNSPQAYPMYPPTSPPRGGYMTFAPSSPPREGYMTFLPTSPPQHGNLAYQQTSPPQMQYVNYLASSQPLLSSTSPLASPPTYKHCKSLPTSPKKQPLQVPPRRSMNPVSAPSTPKRKSGMGSNKSISKLESPRGINKKLLDESTRNQQISSIPTREDLLKGGTLGQSIRVRTNMVSIIFAKNFKVSAVHYDIKFEPDKPNYLKRLAFNELRLTNFPQAFPAFDGQANVYSVGPLPFGDNLRVELTVHDEERNQFRQVLVTISRAKDIDITWLHKVKPGLGEKEWNRTSMQVLDIILRSASYDRTIMVGRSFFHRPRKPIDLGSGMELWTGLFQSAVLGWKTYFNVDIAHKAFPKSQGVLETIQNLCSRGREQCLILTPEIIEKNHDKIQEFFRGLKIVYQVPNIPKSKRTLKFNSTSKAPRYLLFQFKIGESITVEEYFLREKNYRIRYPLLPCLWVGPKQKNIFVPAELCTIAEGNVINRKLDDFQTRAMIRDAATSTEVRERKIMEAYRGIEFNSNPTMNEFGISISGEFTEVDARILDPPRLARNEEAKIMKGVWRMSQFNEPMQIAEGKWTILNLSNKVQAKNLHSLVGLMKNNINGIQIGHPFTPFKQMTIFRNDIRELKEYMIDMKEKEMQLVIVVVPGNSSDVYPFVKQVAEVHVGILTQCIRDDTMMKINPSTTINILHKINAKLNGENQAFDESSKPQCMKVPCIFFGADVSHPSPDAMDTPSIAAVAASHDLNAFKYNVIIQLQPARQEIVLQLEEIVFQQIRRFEEKNQVKPQRIIFYRDGVSEGQFPQVIFYEIEAIKKACLRLRGGGDEYQPMITFLVVQKRHHIRMFPVDKKFSDDKNGNVQVGTVVDSQITHPSHIDFLLVSHASIQGVAKPTKYRCLLNENKMSEDEIEELTYFLCHMFSRCSRSVSYPAPTYYAHLAAFRARALTHKVQIQLKLLDDQEQTSRVNLANDFSENSPMFFV